MAKKIQLSIPEPCHEGWENMTPSEKGRFCGTCRKQVIDFSIMTDREIAQFFKKPSTSSVCGRFMQDQLDRNIDMPGKRIPWVKYFFQFALPAFLFSMKVKAQGRIKIIKAETAIVPAKKCDTVLMGWMAPTSHAKDTTPVKFKGRVTDEKGDPVVGASIKVKDKPYGTITNARGDFDLVIKKGSEKTVLVASSVGFVAQEREIDFASNNEVNITFERFAPMLAGEVLIIDRDWEKRNRKLERQKRRAEKKSQKESNSIFLIPELIKDTVTRLFKTYPNPVKVGSMLTLEWKQKEHGNYILQLISLEGKLIHGRKLWIDDEAKVLSLEVPAVTPGNYFLRMTNSGSGKSFTEKVAIQ